MWHMAILLKYDRKYKVKIYFMIYYVLIICVCHCVWCSQRPEKPVPPGAGSSEGLKSSGMVAGKVTRVSFKNSTCSIDGPFLQPWKI